MGPCETMVVFSRFTLVYAASGSLIRNGDSGANLTAINLKTGFEVLINRFWFSEVYESQYRLFKGFKNAQCGGSVAGVCRIDARILRRS